MSLSPEELAARRHYVGGSDVAAILGVSPYKNVADLWHEKTGRVTLDPTSSLPADLGERLEPALVQLAADMLGHRVESGHRFVRPDAAFKAAQVDGWLPEPREVIEAKCIGLFNRMANMSEWGDDGTDHVPYYVLVQVVWQLHVAEAEVGHVAALLGGGLGFRLYTVRAMPALAAEIDERVEQFWKSVVDDVMPEVPASLSTYRDVIREPEKVVTVDEDFPFAYEDAVAEVKTAETKRDDLRARILQAMGDAEVGYTPFGHFSYRADKRGRRTFRLHGSANR